MTSDGAGLMAYIDASAAALGLNIDTQWRGAVKSNLESIFAMTFDLEDFDLPAGLEPAPVFEA